MLIHSNCFRPAWILIKVSDSEIRNTIIFIFLHFALPCTNTDLFPLVNGEVGKDVADGLPITVQTSNHSASSAEGVHPFLRHSF